MVKAYLAILIILSLNSCDFNVFYNQDEQKSFTVLNDNEVTNKIANANLYFQKQQTNLRLQGSFNEQISEDNVLKENGKFKVIIDFNEQRTEISQASLYTNFYNPKEEYNELYRCYISGPFFYQYQKNYRQLAIYSETKEVDVLKSSYLYPLKHFLFMVPFNFNQETNPLTEEFTITSDNVYCYNISKQFMDDIIVYFEYRFIFDDNGFYQQVDYKKYYNVENYPVYSMHMNVELSNESVDFSDNLEDYWL